MYNLLNSFCSLIYFIIGLYIYFCARVCLGFDFFFIVLYLFLWSRAHWCFYFLLIFFFHFALIGNACNEGIPSRLWIVGDVSSMFLIFFDSYHDFNRASAGANIFARESNYEPVEKNSFLVTFAAAPL